MVWCKSVLHIQACWIAALLTMHDLLVVVGKGLHDGWSTSTLFNALKFRRLYASLQVEFNKAALSLSDSIPGEQRKAALNRLLKVGSKL